MHHRWIVAVLGMVALAYVVGMLVTRVLEASEVSSAFPLVVRAAVVLFLLVAALAGFVGWRACKRDVDWERILAEQRLWESGRLGRAWLERRKKLGKSDS